MSEAPPGTPDPSDEIIRDLKRKVAELEAINAILMGDDEDKPRYTTRRMKQEVARQTEVARQELIVAEADKARLSEALRNSPDQRHFDILVEAMAEVKATTDGHSDQSIADIVQGCLDEIAALSPTAALSGSGSGWRTMDSAPKDGTAILTYSADAASDGKPYPMLIVAWDMPWEWTIFSEDGTTQTGTDYEPTHWHPLPAAPQQGGE